MRSPPPSPSWSWADRRWPLLFSLVALSPVLGGWDLLRRRSASVEAGNGLMRSGKPVEALAEYDKAVAELPADPGAHFDRGTALSALSRFDEAAQEFLRATEAKDTPLKSEAFYNLGNAFFKKDKFKEAGAAYKRSLELDPRNDRAKWNLELALVKQREEEKKKQDQNDKDKDKKDDADKKNGDKDKKDSDKDRSKDSKEDKKDDAKEPKPDSKKDEADKDKDPNKKGEEPRKEPPPAAEPPAEEPRPEEKPAAEKSADEREMESALDGLDKSPKDLEKQRALLRAVRRAPPTRDW